ncbi:MAG: ABC transporter ATP-binding protein/permease, partial [Actinomycetota bacterium]|nr:ABC transporter ATP-binding protein/permease [Actinomycetota bacterium]
IDRGIGAGTAGDVEMATVWALTTVAVVVVGVTATVNWLTRVRLARAAETALAALRRRVFDHVHRLSVAHHTGQQRGTLTTRVTNDIEQLSQFFSWGGIGWIVNLAVMLAVTATMAVYDWRLALVAVASAAPLFLVLKALQRRVLAAWDSVRSRVGEMLGAVAESVSGAAVVRAYGVQDRTTARVGAAVEAHRVTFIRASRLSAVLFPANEVFAVLTTAAVVLAGLALGPGGGLSAGELVAFLFLVALFLEPVSEFTEILDQTQTAVAGWRKVLDVLDTEVDVADPGETGTPLPPGPPEIRLEDVSFAYLARPGGGPVAVIDGYPSTTAARTDGEAGREAGEAPVWALRHVDAVVRSGASVALIGATGSGKSTLAKLLVRFADPTEGRITVAGVPLDRVPFASLRSRLVLVPQEGFLFDGTILDNVRFANPAASEGDVRIAFLELGLEDWLDTLPDGLLTEVGQRGESVSVGERQLVSLARAYVANPTCLLLDEATSAVDPGTETRIARALESLSRGRTSITIAHRLSTAERADWVVVLDAGRLVEQGTHAGLLAAGGAYTHLHESWMDATRY